VPGAGREAVPFVGLTGGLGAGKSEALIALGELGAATLSTDAVVHELLLSDEMRDAVIRRLGPEVAPAGSLDRTRIAERVFGDDEARSWLESVLWPRVGERVSLWRAAVDTAEPAPRAAVVEVPLLFESGMEKAFDATIAVVADESLRRERASARGHAAADERAGRQLSQDEKAQRADFLVRNDGTLDELRQALSRVLAKLDSTPS
jgi:dephospho-CoA kinase